MDKPKEPDFPVALRIRVEADTSPYLRRDGYSWEILGQNEEGTWYNYGKKWSRSLEEYAYGIGGWKRKFEKAKKAARAEADRICAYQCRRIKEYDEWQERRIYEADVECGDCG